MPDISDEILDIIRSRTSDFEAKSDRSDVEEATEEEGPALEPMASVTLEDGTSYQDIPFSTLFWKPKRVPDHYVRVFTGIDGVSPEPSAYIPPKNEFEELSLALTLNLKTLMTGPTGSGKTQVMEYYAAKTGRPFVRICHDVELDRARVFGRTDLVTDEGGTQVTKFTLGLLPKSIQTAALVNLDELSRAPGFATIQYQSTLDRGEFHAPEADPGEQIVYMNENCRIVATDNTKGNGDDMDLYSASNVQDASFINRWDILIELDYLSEAQERKLVGMWTDKAMPREEVERLCTFSRLMHKGFLEGKIQTAFSPRNLQAICRLYVAGVPIKKALDMNYIKRASKSEISDINECLKAVYG